VVVGLLQPESAASLDQYNTGK